MGDRLFRDVVEPSVQVGGHRKSSMLISIVTHVGATVALIVVPVIVATSTLPTPPIRLIDFFDVSLEPPPAPPPLSPRRSLLVTPELPAVPTSAPTGITPEAPAPVDRDTRLGIDTLADSIPGGGISLVAPERAPAAPAPVVEPVRPGGNIKPPTKIKDVAPIYPQIAQAARVQGFVIIEATIGPTGKVQDARVLRSIPLLDAAALDAVRQWEYTPPQLNGQPITLLMTVTVHFRLQ